jgi:hypothetical protein
MVTSLYWIIIQLIITNNTTLNNIVNIKFGYEKLSTLLSEKKNVKNSK